MRRSLGGTLLCACILFSALPPAAAAGGLSLVFPGATGEGIFYPEQGKSVTIQVQDAEGKPAEGVTLSARYRPNAHSTVESTQDIGSTGASGQVDWSPTDAGVVSLEARRGEAHATKLVSVRFSPFPMTGMVIMVLAGGLLLSTVIVSFVRLSSTPVQAKTNP